MSLSVSGRLVWLASLLLLALASAGCQRQAEPVAGVALADAAAASTSVPLTPRGSASTVTPVVTVRLSPTPSPTASVTATPAPTSTPAPTATPTPTPPPQAIRLTTGGCCTQPFWSPDSQQVRFIDKRGTEALAGIWGVPVAEPDAEPVLVSERVEESLARGDYLVETSGNTTSIYRISDRKRWTVPAGGRSVLISPEQTQIAWAAVDDDLPPDQQVATVWVANLDGSGARKVATLRRGGLSGWISEDALLVSGRKNAASPDQVLWTLSLSNGALVEIARAERLRSPTLSPSGNWVAYYVTFAADPVQNGLWLARTDGSLRRLVTRDLFGAYQWRPCPVGGACSREDQRLLIVPFESDAVFHELWELDAATGEARQLTDPATTPFKIANGDWRVSPDGRYVAFVESKDRNIWAIELPVRAPQ
jgi:dipeptidyl aminopeptidase/acylaminoacyl peptidase